MHFLKQICFVGLVWSQNCDLTQKIENGACVDCADGEIQDSSDSSACIACEINQISDATSGCVDCAALEVVEDNKCTACSLDQYVKTGTKDVRKCADCDVNQIVQNNVCNNCPDGQIRDEDSDPRVCKSCAVNQISTSTGCSDCDADKVEVDNQCVSCNEYSYIFTQSNQERVCRECAANEIVQNGQCNECPIGEIRKSDPATECESCAANQISSSTGCLDCETDKVANGDKCVTCQLFEIIFTETSGVRVCKACAKNEIVSNGQCTACSDGQIRDGLQIFSFFRTDKAYFSEKNPLECVTCALNEISSSDGCLTCDAEKVAESNECNSCSIDEFIFTKSDGQRECKECSQNEIAEGNSCNKCPKGKVRDSTKDPRECKDCPVNNVSTENGCIQCPDDQVNVDNQCKSCAGIEFITISSSDGLRSCRTCNLNQIVVDNLCTDCEPGFVRDDADSTKCKACEANQISTSNGCITCLDETAIVENKCAICGMNEVVEEDATTGIRSCKACPIGEIATENACASCGKIQFIESMEDGVRVCKDCKPNQNVIAGECKDCEAGEIRDEADPTVCTACSSNEISTDTGCLVCGDSELVVENECVPCAIGELLVNRDGVRSCVCDNTKGYYDDAGKCLFCDYPKALKNEKCQACSNSEKIEDFKCLPCGENQVQAILKRSCECSFGYPETTNDQTGELECLETAFDEVLIDDDLTKCDTTDLEYPSESKMKCNKCSLGTIPKYDTDNSNWICVNCDVSYEENDEIVCADELCADDPLTTFDTNLKTCTMCPLNSYLDQITDECKECGINQMVVENECVNCLENQMAYYGRCFSCGLDEVIQSDNEGKRECIRCTENAIPDHSINRCENCPVGTIRIEGDDRSLSCRECGAGQKANDGSCIPCPDSAIVVDQKCVECTGNTFPSEDKTECIECAPAQIAFESKCLNCGVDQIVKDNSCIPCAENEKAVDNKCEIIPEDELQSETDVDTDQTSEVANPSSNDVIVNPATNTDQVDSTNLNCRASQVIANGVCTYCAVNHVINLGECVPCNVGESNVDNTCSDKVFKYATVSVLLDTTLTQANMEDKLGMIYDRDLWDTTSDYYETVTEKIETKINQQLLQVSNDDFLMSEVQYFESNGQQVAENQNTDSIIRSKIGFIYRSGSEILTATQEERAKTALLDHLPDILTALTEFDESQTVEDSDLEVIEYKGYSTDSESKQTNYGSSGSSCRKLTAFMFSVFLPIVIQ